MSDNTNLYDFDELGNVIKPIFKDKLNMPLYEDDLRAEYPAIYRDYLDGKIVSQKDFEQALMNPEYQENLESEFLF